MICIYHSKDLDGLACGAIFKKAFPEAKLIGYHYGEPLDEIFELAKSHDLIYMADVSFPILDMIELSKLAKIKIIDHHPTFMQDFLDAGAEFISETSETVELRLPKIRFVYAKHKSACEALWIHLSNEPVPPVIHLLGKYDTWRQEDEIIARVPVSWRMTLGFQMSMRLPGRYSIEYILSMMGTAVGSWYEIAREGMAIVSYQDFQNENFAKDKSYVRTIDGLNVLVVVGGQASSTAFESVWNPEIHDMCAACYYDGSKWTYSLRTMKDGVDVGKFAKGRGGGGHEKAAGFASDQFLFQ